LFGVGYIGYMTFVIALLREQGVGPGVRHAVLCAAGRGGGGVVAHLGGPAGPRQAAGGALATLNGLLGVRHAVARADRGLAAGAAVGPVFGAVFLSVVASTTALVRHNLPPAQWAAGISAFTIVFAAGQIVGPTVVGWIADGPGGLARGLVFSALALWVGALVAWRQKPLA
jgi:hypothetical protein